MSCHSEDKRMCHKEAYHKQKSFGVNGHIFEAKRSNRRAFCTFCTDCIWELGRQRFKCVNCSLIIRNKCDKLIALPCPGAVYPSVQQHSESNVENCIRHSGCCSSVIPSTPASVVLETVHTIGEGLDTSHLSGSGTPAAKKRHSQNQELCESLAQVSVQDIDQIFKDLEASDSRQYNLDDFDLLRVIGRGSYAKVLMVELKTTRSIYAMKVMQKKSVIDRHGIREVQTEKHVFETVSNYPFLVGLHSCFQTPSRLFFVAEFVRGGDLMCHMVKQGHLPEEHARFYAAEITLALNFLHEKGIIYRDLKLDNVLLDEEGHIKLTDYGLCKEGIRPGDTTSTFCGTPNYIAPEIVRGEAYDFSVDWWALGVLLYEMLFGRSPFDKFRVAGNSHHNTEDAFFKLILEETIRVPTSVSLQARCVLRGFLKKNPAERLGCHPQTGFGDITSRPFFKSIDWELLEAKHVSPPYKPKLRTDGDLEYFDQQFTSEPVQLTPDNTKIIEKIDQSEFKGFEYVNPLLMSLEDSV